MSPKKKHANANIALCYIRQSRTKDENDTDSPDRQKSNIEVALARYGWVAEWYHDTEGHKSGTKVINRPGWLALEKRLSDPDVIALVANDLSRLHRKHWRVGQLMELIEECGVRLVTVAPGKETDFSTLSGRLLAHIVALFDEWYAADISLRAKDSVAYRKRNGVTVGLPPFGTKRDKNGYLIPSLEGAWLLPDGSFTSGETNQMPSQDAIWRGYYDAVRTVLECYAEGKLGWDSVAYQMNIERWPFRNRQGEPVEFEGDDIRSDLPPLTRPLRVRVELVPQRQREANNLSCCADDDDYTPAAIVQ